MDRSEQGIQSVGERNVRFIRAALFSVRNASTSEHLVSDGSCVAGDRQW